MGPELGQFPGICIATGCLIDVAVLGVRVRMGNRRGGSKSAECGACVEALHASTCLRRGTEEAQEAGTSSTMFQALKVPGPHIHSVLQPPSTWYYSLPLLQPGTWPAQISAKRQWSLPIQTTACQATGFSALHPSELLTTSSVSGTACGAKPACRLLGHLSFWAVL